MNRCVQVLIFDLFTKKPASSAVKGLFYIYEQMCTDNIYNIHMRIYSTCIYVL